jgi:hypothetical protein
LFGNGSSGLKKRDEKAGEKAQERQDKLEKQAGMSGDSKVSEVSRSTNGRFEGKYKVGDKATDGSIIREVKEDDW